MRKTKGRKERIEVKERENIIKNRKENRRKRNGKRMS